MAYNVQSIGTYTLPNEKVLLIKAVLAAKTIEEIKAHGNVMTGVKSKSQLPSMDTDAVFQEGRACGFTPSGTTAISKRGIEVGSVKIQEALCPAVLETTFEQLNLTAGGDYTEAIFADEYADLKAAKIAKALEIAVWQGDTESGNAQLKRFDGFLKIIDAANGVVDGNTGAETAITLSNVIAIIEAMYAAFPEESIDSEDAVLFMGSDTLRMYKGALKKADLFQYSVNETPGEDVFYGTNLRMVATPGLNGTHRIIGTTWNNMYFATDLLDENEKFELKYAPEAEEVRFSVRFKAGVQVAFPDEVVSYENASSQ